MKTRTLGVLLGACALVLAGSMFAAYHFKTEADENERAVQQVSAFLKYHKPAPFINSAQSALPPTYQQEDDALYTYRAPEGFVIRSFSHVWNDAMLPLLREELLANKHGDEIETLKEIVIYAGESATALASHSEETTQLEFTLGFGALPPDFAVRFNRDVSVIELYGGDVNPTVESMAAALSHEYGHLYTFYYMFGTDGATLGSTEYARLRESEANGLIPAKIPGSNYNENHYRYLFEVAAYDYVQLMGSPATRQVADFIDVRQTLAGRQPPGDAEWNSSTNAWPQENLMLPLARDVPGLAEYYYSFLGEAPPAPAQPKQDVDIAIAAGSKGYDLEEGRRTFVYYTLQWNTPYADAVYTLVCYDPADYYPIPVKTVRPGETASATIGTVTYESGGYIHWYYDDLDQGTKVFYVVALLPDGTYYLSNPLHHTF